MLRQEVAHYQALMRRREPSWRGIVFYAAQAQYIAFFAGMLEELGRQGAKLGYITSDFDDPILTNYPPHLTPFYLQGLFPFALPFLNAKVVVMTMPDLNQFHVRRSIHETNHVYVFHSLMSTHMGFRPGALDHFDTILCAGPHHMEEIRRTEKLYGLKPKRLLPGGYYRLEKIYADHQQYRRGCGEQVADRPCVLIAPSGHTANIIATCAREIIDPLLNADLEVILRPHPMTIYRKPEQLQPLLAEFGNHPNFRLDTETVSEESLHRADVLICDWSGTALEYAFGTERPVLFIDLPRRQQNPEYERLGIPAVEVYLRDKIGRVVHLDEIAQVNSIVQEFLAQSEWYREEIVSLRPQYVYHFGRSAEVSAGFIMEIFHDRLTD